MTLASENLGVGLTRRFTSEGVDPYAQFDWELREARLVDHRDGSVAFAQDNVEVPSFWSVNATNILAQKYFHGSAGSAERETSLRTVIDRIVSTITDWGRRDGYFVDEAEAETFSDELRYVLASQRAAFNSPVWFNIGVKGVAQQASACFILSVEDSIDDILEWYAEEGRIFKRGSGSGANLSRLRSSAEELSGGGTASGPVSFMRGADASAGTIKSGGTTRRAAKMVILDADHPDIEEFVWCKAREERKARALEAAGFDMSLDGVDIHSIQYQNANNSVRLSDEFMQAVVDGSDWDLTARTDGSVLRSVAARDLFHQIAEASWECADPGVQFDTTINRWHTAPNTGPIRGSNPCSEYVHLDDSSCNLASINLLRYLDTDNSSGEDTFDVEGFAHTVQLLFTAQDILVGNADYPTDSIGETSRNFRQLGLGYANLGALLMAMGLPYDSDQGRATAASITALMTGEAYLTSAKLAARMGPFGGFHTNREPMLGVLDMHRQATASIDEDLAPSKVLEAAQIAWDAACEHADAAGVRNSQATVLAPTGTIGLLMDCDTTGIEPDLGLVKTKRLVGGGTMSIVNQTVPRALRRLGYSEDSVTTIVDYINENHSVLGAPGLDPAHVAVFACSLGDNQIHHFGHVKMMAAAQPFLSGAISKTVNMPEEATVEEIEQLLVESWTLGLKAVALYRDNCKVAQPLSADKASAAGPDSPDDSKGMVQQLVDRLGREPVREKLPRSRASRTFEFRVADCKGFVTVGEYRDGRPGEIFVRVSKQGSTLAGIMDAFAISLSHGLQYGVPLGAFVEAFIGMRFEPAGMTDDPELRIASSLIDYLFRRLAVMYLEPEERAGMGILTTGERTQPTLPGVEEQVTQTVQGQELPPDPPSIPSPSQLVAQLELGVDDAPIEPAAANIGAVVASSANAPFCMTCGIAMQRAGACFVCTDCGTTSGCS